jgi:hypothetical protein
MGLVTLSSAEHHPSPGVVCECVLNLRAQRIRSVLKVREESQSPGWYLKKCEKDLSHTRIVVV